MEADCEVVVIDDIESEEPQSSKPKSKKPPESSNSRLKSFMATAPLKSCFGAIVNGKKVSLDIKTLEIIIMNDLKINIKQLDSTIVQILPYMLISYIKSWPGWSRNEDYIKGLLSFDDWFGKFHQYVTFKLKYLIQKDFPKVMNELSSEDPRKEIDPNLQKTTETQCESRGISSYKSFSAFSINIEGPPRILNTLLFAAHQDDVQVKMHTIKAWSADFTIQQLMNWPFLEIEFSSPFLSFTRKIMPDYLRYLARTDDSIQCRRPDFIEEVRVIPNVVRTSYSTSFLKQYLKGYIQYLKTLNLDPNKISEIASILSEFYRDIEEVGAVCDNKLYDATIISFNIGGCRYVRNKKTASVGSTDNKDAPAVGFCEVITPKCSTQLKTIHIDQIAQVNSQLAADPISFFQLTQKLFETQSQTVIDKIPSMMYSCIYCKKQYGGTFALTAVLKHYQEDHRMEHAIMCFDCKKQYNVTDLSRTRWFHSCEFNTKATNPSSVNLYPNEAWLMSK